jgi:hypothetical protein
MNLKNSGKKTQKFNLKETEPQMKTKHELFCFPQKNQTVNEEIERIGIVLHTWKMYMKEQIFFTYYEPLGTPPLPPREPTPTVHGWRCSLTESSGELELE